MRTLGQPQYENPVVQDAALRVQNGTINPAELAEIASTLNAEDAALIGGLIESIRVLEGLPPTGEP